MGDLSIAPLGAGLYEYHGSNDALAFRVRSIQPVARPGGSMTSGSTGFYEASWVLETASLFFKKDERPESRAEKTDSKVDAPGKVKNYCLKRLR